MMTVGATRLREMERAAKLAKRGIWHNYVPAPTGQTKLSDTFVGKVVEVASGDTLVIKDVNAGGAERRVQLSSIRAPRPGVRDRPPEPHGNEAREFMRKRLIGREVAVKMEYTRKVPALGGGGGGDGGDGGAERVLAFGNVELMGAKDSDDKNAAEMAVARGFAAVVRHRTDEERASVYERLVELEAAAKAAKRGVHSAKEAPAAPRLNDVSGAGGVARAKQYLPFFQRAGRVPAVVEYVLSGHRLKVRGCGRRRGLGGGAVDGAEGGQGSSSPSARPSPCSALDSVWIGLFIPPRTLFFLLQPLSLPLTTAINNNTITTHSSTSPRRASRSPSRRAASRRPRARSPPPTAAPRRPASRSPTRRSRSRASTSCSATSRSRSTPWTRAARSSGPSTRSARSR